MRPRSIFFFRGVCARVHGANVVHANICGAIYFHDTLFRGAVNVHTDPIRPDPKRLDLYPACILTNRGVLLRFTSRASGIRSTGNIKGSRDGHRKALPLHFASANPDVVLYLLIVVVRIRPFCAHWMIISCVFADKYQRLLPE